MPRGLSGATLTAFAAAYVRPVDLVEIDLDAQILMLHNRIGPLEHDGNTYTGVGQLGSIGVVTEQADLSSSPVVLELTGIPAQMIALVMDQHYQGRSVRIWRGAVGDDGRIVATPAGPFLLTINTAELVLGSVATIRLSCETRDALWDKEAGGMYTDADQQARHPGDRFCDLVPVSADLEVVWPAVSNAAGGTVNHPRTAPGATYSSTIGDRDDSHGGTDSGGDDGGPAGSGAEG